MNAVNVAIGVIVVLFLFSIFMPSYMANITAANQTGWSDVLTGMTNQYIPLIFGAGILVFVVYAIMIRRKS